MAALKPRLGPHVSVYPQDYRGERWYVLHDRSNGRHLRLSESGWMFIGRLDGSSSVAEIHERVQRQAGDLAPDRDDILLLLTQLFAIDALRGNLPADGREYLARLQNQRRVKRQRSLMNPLAIRLPLLNPDAFLNRFVPWIRPVFSTWGLVLWLLLMVVAGLLGFVNLDALVGETHKDILAPGNVISMLLVYLVIKTVHELAHAFAVKVWGGAVHEMGITLLVLAPVPYVDASAAWAFRERGKRMLVGAAGIIAELSIAALSLFVWVAVEPGWLRDLAFNALLIGTVSTLLFNANPLLRFDGYYVLQDLVEIPNLYSRSSRYYLYLVQRYLFGDATARTPVSSPGEVRWFVLYGPASLVYRLIVLVTIVLYLAEHYLFVGVALGSWAVATQLVMPIARGLRYVATAPALTARRRRAVLVTGLGLAIPGAGLFLLPVPLNTLAQGVVWVPDQAQVYASVDGLVSQVHVPTGDRVHAGDALISLDSPSLRTRIEVLEARVKELKLEAAAQQMRERVQSQIVLDELAVVESELVTLERDCDALTVRSGADGVFVVPGTRALEGRYLRRGELVGYVVDAGSRVVTAVLPQADIGLVRRGVRRVQARFAERPDHPVDVTLLREVPAGRLNLPSAALGAAGGGEIAVHGSDRAGVTAAENVFVVELGLPDGIALAGLGERAYVRFEHGSEPLARQWLRSGRQLLLNRLFL